MSGSPNHAGVWLVAVAVGAAIWWGSRSPDPPPPPVASTRSDSTPARPSPITVYVAGWVSRPGLVELSEGARLADAIAAAGGLLPGAEVAAVNLAAPLMDGEQVTVPGPAGDSVETRVPEGDLRIDLNRATAAELDELPGIGPVIAERIVAYRADNGPFGAVEDLLDVPGIGEAKLADLRDLVVVR